MEKLDSVFMVSVTTLKDVFPALLKKAIIHDTENLDY